MEFVFDGGSDTLTITDRSRITNGVPAGKENFCNLTTLQTEPCSLFSNLLPNSKPEDTASLRPEDTASLIVSS